MLSVLPPSNSKIQQLWVLLTSRNPTSFKVVELGDCNLVWLSYIPHRLWCIFPRHWDGDSFNMLIIVVGRSSWFAANARACYRPLFVSLLLMAIGLDVFSASAIELLDHNVSTNKSAYPHVDLKSLVLDWDDDEIPPQILGSIDLIVYVVCSLHLSLCSNRSRTVWQTWRTTQHRSPHLFAHWKNSFSRHDRRWVIDHQV